MAQTNDQVPFKDDDSYVTIPADSTAALGRDRLFDGQDADAATAPAEPAAEGVFDIDYADETRITDAAQAAYDEAAGDAPLDGDATQLVEGAEDGLADADETLLADADATYLADIDETQLVGADATQLAEAPETELLEATGDEVDETQLIGRHVARGPLPVMSEEYPDDDDEAFQALHELEQRRAERRKKNIIKGAIAAGAIALGIGGFFLFRNLSKPAEQAAAAYQTSVARRSEFTISVQGSGSLHPASEVVVTPEIAGIVDTVSVTEGQQVKEGDVLFTIRSTDVEKEITTAEEGVTKAQKDLDKANEDVAKAEREKEEARQRHDNAQNAANDANARAQAAYDATYAPLAAAAEADFANAQAAYERDRLAINVDGKLAARDNAAAAVEVAQQNAEAATAAVADAQQKYDTAPEAEKAAALQRLNEAKAAQTKAYADQAAADVIFADAEGAYQQAVNDMMPVDVRFDEATTAHSNALAAAASAADNAKSKVSIPDVPPYDEASFNAAIDAAKNVVTTAQTARDTAQKALDEANKKGEQRTVKASKTGTLIALSAKVGAAVGGASGGSTTPSSSAGSLATIADVTSMRVTLQINEVDIASVRAGQRAKVTFSSIQGLEQEATVVDVATTATNAGGEGGGVATYKVECVISKPDGRLKPGMTATVTILTTDLPSVIVVDSNAVNELSDGTSVDVVTNADELASNPEATPETERRKVKTGPKSSSETVIESGLSEGDVLLVGGAAGGDPLAGLSLDDLSSLSEEDIAALEAVAAESTSAEA